MTITMTDLVGQVTPRPTYHSLPGSARYVEWRMPALLGDASVAALLSALVPVTCEVFDVDARMAREVWDEERARGAFQRWAALCVIAGRDDRIVGWTSHSRLAPCGECCLYFDWAGLHPGYQRLRLIERIHFRTFLHEILRRGTYYFRRSLFIAGQTRNPGVYKYLADAIGAEHVYPPINESAPDRIREIAHEIAEWFIKAAYSGSHRDRLSFENESFCLRGAAIGDLDSQTLESSSTDEEVMRLFERALGPDDRLLFVGELSVSRYLAYWASRRLHVADKRAARSRRR